MGSRGRLLVVAAFLLVACGEPGGGTVTTGSSTVAPNTTGAAVTTTTSATSPVTPPTALLVSDVDGVWLWSTAGARERVIDKPVEAAIPDRMGGVIYKELETGRWVADDSQPSIARWMWVGEGSPGPIRWLRTLDSTSVVAVAPPADGTVRPVDVAVVDGHPVLLYVRTRHYEVAATDENPWWDSRIESYLVRDLVTGSETTVVEHSTGWEYDALAASLGDDAVALVTFPYGGDDASVSLRGLDGGAVAMGDDWPSGPQSSFGAERAVGRLSAPKLEWG